MMTKTAWTNNNYEGKALRKIFVKTLAQFERETKQGNADLKKLKKMSKTLSMLAKTKGSLSEGQNDLHRRIRETHSI